ncbi:MAG: tRNA (adenosine(37)-N6)-threonylcarbamoyltransferase complex ATPase subunit type 1 TsaE [Acidobacteriota bacterium]
MSEKKGKPEKGKSEKGKSEKGKSAPAVVHSRSPADTRAFGRELAARLAPAGVVLLEGDLGAGKTVLVQGIAEGLSLDPQQVSSPTFTLVQEYEAVQEYAAEVSPESTSEPPPGERRRQRLVHMDLYRLEPEETEVLGLDEIFADPDSVKAVEWASRLPWRPEPAVTVVLHRGQGDERRIEVIEAES